MGGGGEERHLRGALGRKLVRSLRVWERCHSTASSPHSLPEHQGSGTIVTSVLRLRAERLTFAGKARVAVPVAARLMDVLFLGAQGEGPGLLTKKALFQQLH